MNKLIKILLSIIFVILVATGFKKTVYAQDVGGQKHIEVDLTNQRLFAYEGNRQVYSFLISSGKWFPTPTGTFFPWVKELSTRMVGGNKALGTFYDLPNVPYVVFFGNNQIPGSAGYSIHGTYWHNNFGHPMSHGCINMRIADAKIIYDWIQMPSVNNLGTAINIFGITPNA